jgi:hypothetical protein
VIHGVRFPTRANDDDTRLWIERCDTCEVFGSDEEAANALADAGLIRDYRLDKPAGSEGLTPYAIPYAIPSPAAQVPPSEQPIVVVGGEDTAGWAEVLRGEVVVIDYEVARDNLEDALAMRSNALEANAPEIVVNSLNEIIEEHGGES